MKKRAFLLVLPNILILVPLALELGLTCDNLLVYPIYLIGCALGLVMALIGIAYGLRFGRRGVFLVLLCSATIAAQLLVPAFWRWCSALEFTMKRAEYMEVIDLVRQGRIVAGSSSLADLDAAHEGLMPCTNQIAIEWSDSGLSVIFFTSNGIFGEFRGYMYVEDDHPPTTQQFRELRPLSPDQWTVVRRVEENWYYVIYNH